MKIYGVPISPYVRKTCVALELKGLEYEIENIFPGTRTPEYLAISPLGKIPAFEDDSLIMCDSNVIVEYLEERYPQNPVRPKSVADRAKSRWFEEYGSVLFDPCAEGVFMEQMTKPFTTGQAPDLTVVEHAVNTLIPPVFDYVESQLPAEGFLFGEMMVADIALVSPLINATYTDFEVDADRWPKLKAYLALVKSHPAVAKCMAAEKPLIAALNNANQERLAKAAQ